MIAHRHHPIQRPTDPPHLAASRPPVSPGFIELLINYPHVSLERGAVLFTEGDPSTCMYIVTSGLLEIRSGSVIFEHVGPGAIVGEMGLVERQEPRSATVYAMADSELAEINEARFKRLVAQSPNFAIAVMRTLSRRLRVMDRRYSPIHARLKS